MKSFIKIVFIFFLIISSVVFSGGLNLYKIYCACEGEQSVSLAKHNCCDDESEDEKTTDDAVSCECCENNLVFYKTDASIVTTAVNIDFSIIFITNLFLTYNIVYEYFNPEVFTHKIFSFFFGDSLYKYFHQIKMHIS